MNKGWYETTQTHNYQQTLQGSNRARMAKIELNIYRALAYTIGYYPWKTFVSHQRLTGIKLDFLLLYVYVQVGFWAVLWKWLHNAYSSGISWSSPIQVLNRSHSAYIIARSVNDNYLQAPAVTNIPLTSTKLWRSGSASTMLYVMHPFKAVSYRTKEMFYFTAFLWPSIQ